ncbi:hypothetical protein HY11_14170 [Hyphomonas pacifica]|nr:hypothetical protein HY11_14170 [Hyphomonas pacifica]
MERVMATTDLQLEKPGRFVVTILGFDKNGGDQ